MLSLTTSQWWTPMLTNFLEPSYLYSTRYRSVVDQTYDPVPVKNDSLHSLAHNVFPQSYRLLLLLLEVYIDAAFRLSTPSRPTSTPAMPRIPSSHVTDQLSTAFAFKPTTLPPFPSTHTT